MSIDIHSLMATVDMAKLLQKTESTNIQISDLIHAMAISEPCLFGNSTANLMPVTEVEYDLTKEAVNREETMLVVRMRCDLVAEGLKIPANNNDNYYSAEEVAEMEFLSCVNELGQKDEDGEYYAMKADDAVVHLYSIDLDAMYVGE